jgi:deoxyadenosine/deoxycytidine kinase
MKKLKEKTTISLKYLSYNIFFSYTTTFYNKFVHYSSNLVLYFVQAQTTKTEDDCRDVWYWNGRSVIE